MKIYKFKVNVFFEPVHVYPFRFLENIRHFFTQWIEWQKIKQKFKELNWNDHDVWELTSHCGSFEHASYALCWKITKNKSMHKKMIEKLIHPGFDRRWA